MKRSDLLLGMGAGPTRRTLLLTGAAPGPSRRKALLQQAKIQPTRFQNHKGRDFYLTLRGSYVILKYGRRIYGRKARFMDGERLKNRSVVPVRIRPKRV
jgi:hypothetical protein